MLPNPQRLQLLRRKIEIKREIERRRCMERYYNFFCFSWNHVWPSVPFQNNWHYRYLCDELQKQAERIARRERKEYDIIINVPPRTAKSTIVTIDLNAWIWLSHPDQKFVTASWSDSLAVGHSNRTRRLIQSEWYQRKLTEENYFHLMLDQDTKSNFENNKGGYRIATSVGGRGTGEGGDWVIADDPLSAQQSKSEAFRDRAVKWWNETMYSRLNDQDVGIRIVVMQRLHEGDVTGAITLDKELKGYYKHICLPGDNQEGEIKPEGLKKYYSVVDEKTKRAILFKERLPARTLDRAKKTLGSYEYAGQYGQNPSPESGGMFKIWYWRFWIPRDKPNTPHWRTKLPGGKEHIHTQMVLPETFDDEVQSWDMTFKDNDTGVDRVSGQYWTSKYTEKFLIDQMLQTMDFVRTKESVLRFYSLYFKNLSAVLIEDKANGPAVLSELGSVIPILIPVTPLGSKVHRALDTSKGMSMVAQAEAGHIWLPHPSICSWTMSFISEYGKFPRGQHDDQVDSGTQALFRLTKPDVFDMFTSADFEKEILEAAQKERELQDKEDGITVQYTHDNSGYGEQAGKPDGQLVGI